MDAGDPINPLLVQRWPSKRSISLLPQVPNFEAICPPSTTTVAPLMYDARSGVRNTAAGRVVYCIIRSHTTGVSDPRESSRLDGWNRT